MDNTDKMIREAWEKRVSTTSAHITLNAWLVSFEKMKQDLRPNIGDKLKLAEKTVIEYGIGGGWIGKYLLEDCGIHKYIGYDIAPRCIAAANKTLVECGKGHFELHLIDEIPDFDRADVFITRAVIQHFPNLEYFKRFFAKLDASGIGRLVIHFREGAKTEFQKVPYKTTKEIGLACRTTKRDIEAALPSYQCYDSSVTDGVGQRYLYFKKKRNNG